MTDSSTINVNTEASRCETVPEKLFKEHESVGEDQDWHARRPSWLQHSIRRVTGELERLQDELRTYVTEDDALAEMILASKCNREVVTLQQAMMEIWHLSGESVRTIVEKAMADTGMPREPRTETENAIDARPGEVVSASEGNGALQLGDCVRVNESCQTVDIVGDYAFVSGLDVLADSTVNISLSYTWPPRYGSCDGFKSSDLDKVAQPA